MVENGSGGMAVENGSGGMAVENGSGVEWRWRTGAERNGGGERERRGMAVENGSRVEWRWRTGAEWNGGGERERSGVAVGNGSGVEWRWRMGAVDVLVSGGGGEGCCGYQLTPAAAVTGAVTQFDTCPRDTPQPVQLSPS